MLDEYKMVDFADINLRKAIEEAGQKPAEIAEENLRFSTAIRALCVIDSEFEYDVNEAIILFRNNNNVELIDSYYIGIYSSRYGDIVLKTQDENLLGMATVYKPYETDF